MTTFVRLWRSLLKVGFVSLGLAGCRDVTEPKLSLFHRVAFTVDPAPDSAGYFIPGVTPDACFLDQNPSLADPDRDWLDQNCEVALAKAFNPLLRFSMGDPCPEREPVWAAKYFHQYYSLSPKVVRIAYMTSYHEDCGTTQSHQGDSEMIMVEVTYNSNTEHWILRQMWTSAHYGEGTYDRSRWTPPAQIEFPDKHLGFPRVYVASGKHGGFPTRDSCNNGAFGFDYCHPEFLMQVRDSIIAERNAGSRYNPFLLCIFSVGGRGHTGRCESYYPDLRFNGWAAAAPGVGGASPYRKVLMNAMFERRDEFYSTWGPGPSLPNQPPPYSTSISGPTSVRPGELCQWFVSSSLSGTPEWLVDGETRGTGWSIWTSFGESTVLSVLIQNGGDHEDDARSITVSPSAPPCSTEV